MREDLELLMEAVNSQFAKEVGGPILQMADQITNPFILRRPTGILSMDIGLKGGFPAGTLCQVAGPASVGKNALCNQVASRVQDIYGDDACIAWVCTEMSLDKMFAHRFGLAVPMSDFEISMVNAARADKGLPILSPAEVTFRKRSVGQFVIIDSGTSAQRLEVTLRLIESNKFQLIIIDSLASLLTDQQDETELQDEPQQSSEARLITRFCNKYWGRSGRAHEGEQANWTTVIATYQVRSNRSSALYKKDWTVGGAYALKHAKAIDIHLSSAGRYPKDTEKPATGKMVKWEIAKGKAGCHEGPKGEVLYLHKEGFDVYGDAVNAAKAAGVLVQAGKWWKLMSEEEQELQKFSGGTEGVVSALMGDDALFASLYRSVLRKEGVECVYKL